MLLTVNRDSVCMGDDVHDHAVELDVDGAGSVGAVVADLLGRYRLACVAGEVAWRIELRSGRYEVVGERLRAPERLDLALLHMPDRDGGPTFIPLAPHLLDASFGDTLRALGEGPAWVHFTYISDGARVRETELARYRAGQDLSEDTGNGR